MMTRLTILPVATTPQGAQVNDSTSAGLFELSLLLAEAGVASAAVGEPVFAVGKNPEPGKSDDDEQAALNDLPSFMLPPITVDPRLIQSDPNAQPGTTVAAAALEQSIAPASLFSPAQLALSTEPRAGKPSQKGEAKESLIPAPLGFDSHSQDESGLTHKELQTMANLAVPERSANGAQENSAKANALAQEFSPCSRENSAVAAKASLIDSSPTGRATNGETAQITSATPAGTENALLGLLQAAHVQSTSGAAPVQVTLSAPVGTPAWRDELATTVSVLSQSGKHMAELTLHPAQMGPIEVRIQINDGHATVSFSAQHITTREAIESALPQLREMFGGSGISLGQTTVGGQQPGRQPFDTAPFIPGIGVGEGALAEQDTVRVSRMTILGNIDTFV